ncbi:ATP-binding protein [Mucilaginibacter sp. RS28]|uniref:Oxygen sensor histidine kinase NreB n=1 Tax=Mucilaginibacter straminoryzae TaxID=2932774 RepID=A0A9X1X3T2_9SPHI|nr:ATP-binding protein [Mucilaginibacter straminoryzae]MCJ8210443.1 ATP-binding protein [Mucilaginibacter straminoryzae]
MGVADIRSLVLIATAIFLIAPVFLLAYVLFYNSRKKKHIEEKAQMKQAFETELIKAQAEVQEQTLQTIGADLHDNIGQLLSLISLNLNSIELTEDIAKAQKKIEASASLTLESIKELRLLGKLLHGDQLVINGLAASIEQLVLWISKADRFKVEYHVHGEAEEKNTAKDLIIFRIVQETVNNIVKHADASEIVIELTFLTDMVAVKISDNGVGFDVNSITANNKGMGLHNIYKRAMMAGGRAEIRSVPGSGSYVNIFVPYQ